jgi:hypothetical protein
MKGPVLVLLMAITVVAVPAGAHAAAADVPAACRLAIAARWPAWRLSPPPPDLAAYAKQEGFDTNEVLADFDGDARRDAAVLFPPSATPEARPYLAMCLSRGRRAELHAVQEPYGDDGTTLSAKGSRAYDYEREAVVRYRTNGVHAMCFEKAGATYLFERAA